MNYHQTIKSQASQLQIIKALTTEIPNWWTEDFSGSASKVGDQFTVRFGKTYKQFVVTTLNPGNITWTCLDSFIDLPELNKKDEWKGTKIHWEIAAAGQENHFEIVHEGLTPEIECYDICQQGWTSFLGSLKQWLDNKEGQPFKPEKENSESSLNEKR